MPSPFPGMDPYLEGLDWPSVHTQLSVEIARYLSPRLRPKYFVRTEKTYILASPDPQGAVAYPASRRAPDVSVVRSGGPVPVSGTPGAALLEAPVHVPVIIPEQVPQVTVEIHDAAARHLVTAIEVLSPINKRGDGREEYLSRRRRLLRSPTHLIEIDLLRTGERVPMAAPLPPADYFVILSRAEKRPITDVWPIRLTAPLPTVPVPLLSGDDDVRLDLQQVLTTMYDTFSYDLEIDYTRPPAVPLPPEAAEWARQVVAAAKN